MVPRLNQAPAGVVTKGFRFARAPTMNVSITVNDIGKCYKVGLLQTVGGYKTVRESLSRGVGSMLNRLRGGGGAKTTDDFWR